MPLLHFCVVQLLSLELPAARALVLRQPSLLARTGEGLAGKVEAYAALLGQEQIGAVGTTTQLCFVYRTAVITATAGSSTSGQRLPGPLMIYPPDWRCGS